MPAAAAANAAGLTLEALYRAEPFRGEVARDASFSHSGRYLAYRWNGFGEPGTDLYVYDTTTGKTRRLTSPGVMARFDAPEDIERFERKFRQKQDEAAERQAREIAQQAYLRGEAVDLNQWERTAIEKVRQDVAAQKARDDARKAADKADAEAEKIAMAALAARRAGKPVPAAVPAAPAASAASAAEAGPEKEREAWEWRDELKKSQAKNKLKDKDLYPGVAQIVWAHHHDELVFQYRGALFRWLAGSDALEPLQATQRELKIVGYTADDRGYVFSDETRVLRSRFEGGGIEIVSRELINADDAERKYKLESTAISEDGRWMAVVARAPLKNAEEGKPAAPDEGRKVEIMNYAERWATAKKVPREVSDDKRSEKPYAVYIRRVPAAGEAPRRQPEPVFTQAGGDGWFELSDIAWARDGSRYAFTTWEREKELLRVYLGSADERAKPQVVLERRGDVGHEVVNVLQPRFTPDGRTLVLALDEAGFRQPYAIDVATRALRPLLARGDFESTKVLGFTPDSRTMFVTANREDFAAMNVYRVDMASGAMTALGAAGDYHRDAVVSDDGRWLAANAGNWAARPELKLLDASGRSTAAARPLTSSYDARAWAAVDQLRPERFSYTNRHGDAIQAFVFKPAGWQPSDRRPAVVYTYGGPLNDRHIVEVDSFQQTGYLFAMYMAVRHGYVTVAVDPRGHSNYGRKFSDANWENPGASQAEDLEDLKAYMDAKLGVDPARVGLTGWSFGGYETQYVLYNKPELFAAGIAGAGPTEWENYNSWYSGRTIGKVDRTKPVLRKYSLLPMARNLKRPLLLIHGMQDPNVLYQDTVNVYRELLASGKDALVDLYLDPDGVHALGGTVKPVGLHRKMEAYWLAHLGEAGAPPAR